MSSDPAGGAPPPLGGRLHPAAIALWPSQQVVGLIAVFVFGGGPRGFGVQLLTAALTISAMAAAVRWARFRWRIDAGALVIEQGLLQRRRRVIPLDRVQAVDLVRPLRHRVLRVVRVHVEAIGDRESEGVLEALDPTTAAAVQRALGAARDRPAAPGADGRSSQVPGGGDQPVGALPVGGRWGAPAAAGGSAERQLAAVATRDLVVAGLTGGRVGVLAVLLGALQQVVGVRVEDALALVPADATLVAGAVLVAGIAVVVFALSVAATVATHWRFTLTTDGERLRISRGLLEQRQDTVPLRRIQSVRIEQNLLRRWLGLAAVRADLAGRAGGDGAQSGLLLPVGPVSAARALVAELLGGPGPVDAPLEPAPPRSRRRYVVRGLAAAIPGAALGAAAVVVGAPAWMPAAGALLGVAVGVPLALAVWRALGWAEVDGVLVARTGALVRRRVHVPVGRVQAVVLQATPFQRRLGLVDVAVGIARSGGWAGPQLRELDEARAMALVAGTVHDAVAQSRRSRPVRRAVAVPPPPP